MNIPADRKYTKEHEWIVVDADVARVGVTQYAADALGDVVYVDLPEVGSTVTADQTCGEIESTKSVSDLYSPATGEITAVNSAVVDAPETINSDPYDAGWLYEMKVESLGELLDDAAYAALVEAEQ